MRPTFDQQGLAVVTHAQWLAAHRDANLFPYLGGRNGALRMLYAIGTERFGAPSDLPPPSLKSRDVITMYAHRDGWVCHLCSEPIAKDAIRSKHGASPDHLIPRNHGGSDHPGNILTAHLSCNKSRRDNPLAHGVVRESLTELYVSYHRVTHDRKGREGKGVRKGRDVGAACILSHGSEGARSLAALPSPGDACDEIDGGQ